MSLQFSSHKTLLVLLILTSQLEASATRKILSNPVLSHAARACVASIRGLAPDPYHLDFGLHPISEVKDLEINFPTLVYIPEERFIDLEEGVLFNEQYFLSRAANLRAVDYLSLKTGEEQSLSRLFRMIETPRIADVFLVFPKTQNQGIQWIRKSGELILKSMSFVMTADEKKSDKKKVVVGDRPFDFKRTSLALEYMLQITPYVYFNGRPFIDVNLLYMTEHTASTGVFEQAYVFGPTARQLQQSITASSFYVGDRMMTSEKFLAGFGLTKERAIRLQPQLDALEEFYRRLNAWAFEIGFLKRALYGIRNKSGHQLVPLLFDFNHGQNIIYDVQNKRFVVIDG